MSPKSKKIVAGIAILLMPGSFLVLGSFLLYKSLKAIRKTNGN